MGSNYLLGHVANLGLWKEVQAHVRVGNANAKTTTTIYPWQSKYTPTYTQSNDYAIQYAGTGYFYDDLGIEYKDNRGSLIIRINGGN